jgi:outer membrane protein assembly factor BamB
MGNPVALDYRSNYTSQSPVTHGKLVIFYYGNGDLVAYDFAGTEVWRRNIQKEYGDYNFGWTYSSTPLVFRDRLYIQVLQRNQPVSGRGKDGAESYLLALEPATGKEIWRHVRPSPARGESLEAFTTPIPFTHNGRTELLLAGGDVISGHDPDTGKEFWRWGTWNAEHRRRDYRLVPSPVAVGSTVLVCGPKREPVFGIKAGQQGDISADGMAWKSEPESPLTADVSTPLIYKDRLYLASDQRKTVTCADPATGKIHWSTPINGVCWASATGADGKIYAMSLKGEVYVLDAESGELLATNAMALPEEDEIRSTPVVAHGALFIRTPSKLYCIAKP